MTWKKRTAIGAGAAVTVLTIATLAITAGGWVKSLVEHRQPLTLTALHIAGFGDGWSAVVPAARGLSAKLHAAHDCQSLADAAYARGAADVGLTYIELIAEGTDGRTTTVIHMDAQIVSRELAPPGMPEAICIGGGVSGVYGLELNLDRPNPVPLQIIKKRNGHTRVGGPFFNGTRVVTLANDEVQPFYISATSRTYITSWRLRVIAVVHGRPRTFVVDDHGQPFRTAPSSAARNPGTEYMWDWAAKPPRLVVHQF